MGQLNWKRLILGGLLAGMVIDASQWLVNGVIFGGDWVFVMQGLHRSTTISVKQMVVLNLWGFLTGIAMMWLYASFRPRYGAGPRTAVIAGRRHVAHELRPGRRASRDHAHFPASIVSHHAADWPGGSRLGCLNRPASCQEEGHQLSRAAAK